MYKNRIFKSFWGIVGSAALVGTVSLSTVSCGHKSSTVNAWDTFKKAALAETAPNLKTTISNLKTFYWTPSDVAIFDSSGGGTPAISSADAHTIVATIVIKDKTSQLQYPIKFSIKYSSGSKYEVTNWTYSQTPGLNKWSDFKATALKITAAALLEQAKNSKILSTLKWADNPINNTWTDAYKAEFDVYGGKGINGNPVADDANFSVTAIISIKDPLKQGLYDANPIKAVINDNDNSNYAVGGWKFSAVAQSQSTAKYTALVKDQIDLAKLVVDPKTAAAQPEWATFGKNNYAFIAGNKTAFNMVDYLSNDQHPHAYGFAYVNGNTTPITGGISSVISFTFYDDSTNSPANPRIQQFALTLTNNFLFNTTDKTSGPAFSYLWTVTIKKIIPSIKIYNI